MLTETRDFKNYHVVKPCPPSDDGKNSFIHNNVNIVDNYASKKLFNHSNENTLCQSNLIFEHRKRKSIKTEHLEKYRKNNFYSNEVTKMRKSFQDDELGGDALPNNVKDADYDILDYYNNYEYPALNDELYYSNMEKDNKVSFNFKTNNDIRASHSVLKLRHANQNSDNVALNQSSDLNADKNDNFSDNTREFYDDSTNFKEKGQNFNSNYIENDLYTNQLLLNNSLEEEKGFHTTNKVIPKNVERMINNNLKYDVNILNSDNYTNDIHRRRSHFDTLNQNFIGGGTFDHTTNNINDKYLRGFNNMIPPINHNLIYNNNNNNNNNNNQNQKSNNGLPGEGEIIDNRFQIIKAIGKGSFGQVYKCIDLINNQLVALKIIIAEQKALFNQSKIEKSILENLNKNDPSHEFVVHLVETFIWCNHMCFVFELLNMNLYERLQKTNGAGLDFNTIKLITSKLIRTLAFIFDNETVHCDLKPENIMLCDYCEGLVKLVDFGSSCVVGEQIYSYIQSRFYRAPEVILEMYYSKPIDVWSMGCVLAELSGCDPLFYGRNELDQLGHMIQYLGIPPIEVLQKSKKFHKYFEILPNGYVMFKPDPRFNFTGPFSKSLRSYLSKNRYNIDQIEDLLFQGSSAIDESFENLIFSMLNFDPKKRATPYDLMFHPFLFNILTFQLGVPREVAASNLAAFRALLQNKKNFNTNLVKNYPTNKIVQNNIFSNKPSIPYMQSGGGGGGCVASMIPVINMPMYPYFQPNINTQNNVLINPSFGVPPNIITNARRMVPISSQVLTKAPPHDVLKPTNHALYYDYMSKLNDNKNSIPPDCDFTNEHILQQDILYNSNKKIEACNCNACFWKNKHNG